MKKLSQKSTRITSFVPIFRQRLGTLSCFSLDYFLVLFLPFFCGHHTWKKQSTWAPQSSTFKKIFRKICSFCAKFGSLNMQIRNNFKNDIFIAYKWCKICTYCGLDIWFKLFCCNYKFVIICVLFAAKSVLPKL